MNIVFARCDDFLRLVGKYLEQFREMWAQKKKDNINCNASN